MYPTATPKSIALSAATSDDRTLAPPMFNPNSFLNFNDHSHEHQRYSSYPHSATSNYVNLLRTWNYHRFLSSTPKNDLPSSPSSSSFHPCSPHLAHKSLEQDTDGLLQKFHHETLVNLETGPAKNIQHLTTNDFLVSAKQNRQYSSLLARVDYIGSVDLSTGKAEIRFFINEIEKMTSYYVVQEMPFFVHQHSCWSSISPESTRHRCGLICRQLICGDIILAITEQQTNVKPDYRQQSPTKSLIDRYRISSNKRHKMSNE